VSAFRARRGRLLAAVTLPTAALAAIGPATAGVSAAHPPNHVAGTHCQAFPANDVWHADVSKLPVNAHSRQWLAHMHASTTRLHPDFGPSYGDQPVPYGIPITVVGGSHAKVRVRFTYSSESDHVRYPLGRDTKIEGGKGASGDRHAVVVDKSTCRLYETYATYHRKSGWHAGSGATWSLKSNKLRPATWTSADAAGLPIMPGLLRYAEVENTHYVDHAIRFTTDRTQTRFIWPARHEAGSEGSAAYPPMGARVRLKASFDISHFRRDTKAVLRAMKHFGLILADNGSPWYFQGQSVKGWPSAMLDQLKSIPASAFVAVDEACLRVSKNSGQARAHC
jgi:hypothetical protein